MRPSREKKITPMVSISIALAIVLHFAASAPIAQSRSRPHSDRIERSI
jgi:hypothetical protein